MKHKSKRCSTGHGTGVIQERELRHRLDSSSRRLRFGNPRLGPRDYRGRSISRTKYRTDRRTSRGADFDLLSWWQDIAGKPKRTEPKKHTLGPSFRDRLQECGTAREAEKLLAKHAPAEASADTRRKWARVIELKREAEARS